ncbi:MAG TPA: hypothetical protein VGN79_04440 [Devosia sp.]|jgi:hypothetical protein|uniref:hypothetical protein n=1 Tax=unclassified Sphingomonas TaxID=196159 RepID=UPI000DBC1802|nr:MULTISPECIES: hypothetical protein [unclassified Sphingomonas]PZT90827.1 MAG: hypothetical protein DI625_17030 [Sphingomonas sp.]RSV29521.1 hypothetical protein CA237_08915 [Sphingomonas sp. ABOLH]HEV7291547.1 hypothetical protein [Devosia sp.]
MAVLKRKIFYIAGFDARGARYYHHLLDEQLASHAAKTGERITVSPRTHGSRMRDDWAVENATAGVSTAFTFLRWDDLVRVAWVRNPLTLAWRTLWAYLQMLGQLDFARLRPMGRGQLVTFLYPLLLAVVLPAVIALAAFGLLVSFVSVTMAAALAVAIGLAGAVPLLRRVHAPWLIRFYIFNAGIAKGWPAALDARLDDFVDAIASEVDGYDEVLLVTHSNGSILAMPVMDRLLARWQGVAPAGFALVTLGQCIPLLACRRDAALFRDTLGRVAQGDFRWIDIGSPPDGAAYHGVNPLLIHADTARPRVELISPRFHLFYDPATYHRGLRNKFEIHFDYLRSGDRVSPVDLPSLTTAPRPIDDAVDAVRRAS